MNEWLLSIVAAAALAAVEVGILLCSAVLGAFVRTLSVGVVILVAGAAVYRGRNLVLAKRRPGDRHFQP